MNVAEVSDYKATSVTSEEDYSPSEERSPAGTISEDHSLGEESSPETAPDKIKSSVSKLSDQPYTGTLLKHRLDQTYGPEVRQETDRK